MFKGDGEQAPITGWTGLWQLLPLVGWFVWIVKVQGRNLNRYWESHAAPSAPAVAEPFVRWHPIEGRRPGKSRNALLSLSLHRRAGIAQLVEHQLPKLRVAGSNPVSRSEEGPA